MLQGTDRVVLEGPTTPVRRWHHLCGAIFLLMLVAGFAGVLVRLVLLQYVRHEQYRELAVKQQTMFRNVRAHRGIVYAMGMRPLVVSEPVQSVFAAPVEIENLRSTAGTLAGVLNVDEEQLYRRLLKCSEMDFAWVKRRLSDEECKKLAQLNLPGVHFRTEFRRRYPQGNLAAHVLGWTDIDNRGREGLEALFNSDLAGRCGYERTECDSRRRAVVTDKAIFHEVIHGASVVLTLDVGIQRIVEQELSVLVERFDPVSATVIVMDPHTGRILALSNRPTFNPARPAASPAEARQNRAVMASYEPGSVFKPFAMATLFDLQLGTPGERVFCENGLFRIPGRSRPLRDHHHYGWLTMSEVIEKSSNIGMAKVGLALGKEQLHRTVRNFGFGATTGIDMPGEISGTVTPFRKWNIYTLTSVPMGQEIAVTPLQLLNAFNVFANGGWLLKPAIVEAVLSTDGKVLRRLRAPERVRRVISSRTASLMVAPIMHNVVTRGTGKSARDGLYTKFGKTGTAQKADETGGYSHTRFVSSFLCGGPTEDVKLTVLVLVNEPRKGLSYYASTVAAPTAGRIIERALKHMGVPPSVRDAHRAL